MVSDALMTIAAASRAVSESAGEQQNRSKNEFLRQPNVRSRRRERAASKTVSVSSQSEEEWIAPERSKRVGRCIDPAG